MSLFPAYVEEIDSTKITVELNENKQDSESEPKSDWLTNSSYNSSHQEQLAKIIATVSSDSEQNADNVVELNVESVSIKKSHKHKHKKKRKKESKLEKSLENFKNADYYVDKKPCKGYLVTSTLHKPACPRYNHELPLLGRLDNKFKGRKQFKRYFTTKNYNLFKEESNNQINEEEYDTDVKKIKTLLKQNPKNIENWLNLVNMQNDAPIKCSKTQLAEKKINVIERALVHNCGDEKLYRQYIDIINSIYPSFDVSKILDKLLIKDPTNYNLWNAQILSTQGSMARCTVPNVLKLYGECMDQLYKKSKNDEILLKFFFNCALFLRQAGLSEQFFALIKLGLELNISVDKFTEIQPSQNDQQILIEYEEVILKSGLPINEIWLRIEKLRQNFNFLPCPVNSVNCSDPQRIIFNEDICNFIYPLGHKENSFHLILLILKLIKIPINGNSTLQEYFLFKLETHNEFDSIEEILSIFFHQTSSSNLDLIDFNSCLYDVIKDLFSSPSYMFTNIGSEIYFNTVVQIILLCAECFEDDNRKKEMIILIWLRFERIIVILKKIAGKLLPDDHKKLKTKVKNFLKKEKNRNLINIYAEYALIEYQFENYQIVDEIFVRAITDGDSQVPNSDFCHAYVCYAELMLQQNNSLKAIKILTCYTLNKPLINLDSTDFLTETKKLAAFKQLTDRLNSLIQIEKNVQIMEIEQHFLPDFFTSLLKAKIYYQYLLNEKLKAMAYLENTLRHFNGNSKRTIYIREQIYELYLKILQLPCKSCLISNLLIYEISLRALKEFPNNIFILRTCATLDGQPWYKLRSLLKYSVSPIFVIFLIASIRKRFLSCNKMNCDEINILSSDIDGNEETYKARIKNLLKSSLDKNSILKKNSLLWRIYLRNICEFKESFDKTKNILFAALDECPWNKELYLDGAICVPQEFTQLQDLLIEKQLRIYALPEELEILRNDENMI